ncbi:MAG: hypothetical protein JJT82_03560 [Legionellaceae bacterium]|nr:hypothetical protein [Legionellaceae bacterium]
MFNWFRKVMKNHVGKFALASAALTVGMAAVLISCPPAGALLWGSVAVGAGVALSGTSLATGGWLALQVNEDNTDEKPEEQNKTIESLSATVAEMKTELKYIRQQNDGLIANQESTESKVTNLNNGIKALSEQIALEQANIIESQEVMRAEIETLAIQIEGANARQTAPPLSEQSFFRAPLRPQDGQNIVPQSRVSASQAIH